MRVSDVSTEKRTKTNLDVTSLGIQSWDRGNLYPQKLWDAIAESGTALSCIEVYAAFIRGAGFPSEIADNIVNREGQTLNDILALVSQDRAKFGGFAVHINYNEFYEAAEFNYVPFEHTRLGIPNKDTGAISEIAINSDWAGLRIRPDKKNTTYLKLFNPQKQVVAAQIEAAGGVENYKGQLLWFSNNRGLSYPTPICDAIITDINSEGGCATVKNRNVKNNFFGAGIFIVEGGKSDSEDNVENASRHNDDLNEESNLVKQIKKMQTDRNAVNVAVLEVERGATPPKFEKFSGMNYDGAFQKTEDSVQKNIGRRFKQPPILRCEEVATGFATEAMQDAYNFYNSVTQDERGEIERAFTRLLGAYTNYIDLTQFKIIPKSFNNATNQ